MTASIYFAIFVVLFIGVCARDEPYQIPTATINDVQLNMYSANVGYTQNAAGGKYILTRSRTRDSLVIYEKNSGTYITSATISWSPMPTAMTTNGNWFGTLGGGSVTLFQLNSGAAVNKTTFSSTATLFQLLSDNSLILLSNTTMDTYDYVGGVWTKIRTLSVNFVVTNINQASPNEGKDDESVPHLTDTTLAAFNPIKQVVQLYKRNADKSWTLFDEVAFDFYSYKANRILWNGDDTVTLAHRTFQDTVQTNNYGQIVIYTKVGTSWAANDFLYDGALASFQPSFLGYYMMQYTKDIILVSAPGNQTMTGEVFFLRKINGAWTATRRLMGPISRQYFGYSIMKNDYDIIIQSFANGQAAVFHLMVPACYKTIIYQCQNVTLDTCQPNSDIPYNQLYTVGDSCTNVRLESFRLGEETSTFSFSFSRADYTSETFYCNSTVTCPRNPPVAPITPPTTPLVNSPTGSPQVSTPITTPVDVPSTSPVTSIPPNISPVNNPVDAPNVSPIATPNDAPSNSPIASPVTAPSISSPVATPASTSPVPYSPSTASPINTGAPTVVPVKIPSSPLSSNGPAEEGKVTSEGNFIKRDLVFIALTVFCFILT